MLQRYYSVALPLEDDVMIALPDEFGYETDEDVELRRRNDGVIEMARLSDQEMA